MTITPVPAQEEEEGGREEGRWHRVEPLIKDTLNKGHLCILKDTFQCTDLHSGNNFYL